jgi:hypothetical protein
MCDWRPARARPAALPDLLAEDVAARCDWSEPQAKRGTRPAAGQVAFSAQLPPASLGPLLSCAHLPVVNGQCEGVLVVDPVKGRNRQRLGQDTGRT